MLKPESAVIREIGMVFETRLKNQIMKYLAIVILLSLSFSCIPLKIAPNMEHGEVVKAKRFVKELPNQYAYVFDDPKDANEFYNYINAKYQITYEDGNVPVIINERKAYLTFYEVNKETQTVNLIPILVNSSLEEKGYNPILKDAEETRFGKWYIALTVTDEAYKDCLNPKYDNYDGVTQFVAALRQEYLTTTDYIEVYLRAQ